MAEAAVNLAATLWIFLSWAKSHFSLLRQLTLAKNLHGFLRFSSFVEVLGDGNFGLEALSRGFDGDCVFLSVPAGLPEPGA